MTVIHPDYNAIINVPLGRGGKFGSMSVDLGKFAPTIHDHVYAYGLRQILNDAMADKTDEDGLPLPPDQIVAKAQKRLDSLYAGELRVRGASAEPLDPVEREAYRMARDAIEKQFRALGLWPAKGTGKFQVAVDARRIATNAEPMAEGDYVAAWLERNPKVMAAAKRIVAERDKSNDVGDLV